MEAAGHYHRPVTASGVLPSAWEVVGQAHTCPTRLDPTYAQLTCVRGCGTFRERSREIAPRVAWTVRARRRTGRDHRRTHQHTDRRRPRFAQPRLTIHQRPFPLADDR